MAIHEYPVSVSWQGGREGSGVARPAHSGTSFNLAVPPEFQGTGGGTNPEELLTTAVSACYTMTFAIITANRKLPVTNIETKAVGQVEQQGMSFTYKQITVRPKITVGADTTDEQVQQVIDFAHKADAYCIITNAVRGKVEIAIEPTVVRE